MNPTAFFLSGLLSGACATAAHAQAHCSSDAAPQPVALFERFISADCEACWSDPATPAPSADAAAVVLDWIVPSPADADAPLSAAATRDALARLQGLGRTATPSTDVHVSSVRPSRRAQGLRVAQGLPFNDYVGTGIGLARAAAPRRGGSLRYFVVLVEAVPAGTEGTPVPRQVVRNLLQGSWDAVAAQGAVAAAGWKEARPMRIPDGAQPGRLRVVGWVQDGAGTVVAAAQSVCR